VCVELHTSAVVVTLPHLLLSAVLRCRCCSVLPLSIDISCLHWAQQQTRTRCICSQVMGQTDGLTDGLLTIS